MIVKIGKLRVDVADADCGERDCFVLGFDKGSFSQGRGYTSYHKVERPVCATRHYHGCPVNSVCATCRYASVSAPGSACAQRSCEGITLGVEIR